MCQSFPCLSGEQSWLQPTLIDDNISYGIWGEMYRKRGILLTGHNHRHMYMRQAMGQSVADYGWEEMAGKCQQCKEQG